MSAPVYAGGTGVRATASNTTSVIRIGAYGSNSGVGTPVGSGGFGALPATTKLEIAAGTSGLVNANAQFDLNGSTQTVRSLSSRELAGSKTLTFNGGTLNINNPAGLTTNEIFSGIFDGLGTINVNGTHANGWALRADTASATFNSNIVHRGSINVNAGKIILDPANKANKVRFHDKMVLQPDGTVLNTALVTKFGFPVAVTEVNFGG